MGSNIRNIILRLHTLGRAECVLRNSHAIHEKQGVYENVGLSGGASIALNIAGIGLRIFPEHWHHAIAVEDAGETPSVRSIQLYDKYGAAIQKVFMRDNREKERYNLADALRTAESPRFLTGQTPAIQAPAPLPPERLAAFHERWINMKDVRHFGDILESFGLDRQTAYAHTPEGMAAKVHHGIWEQFLEKIHRYGSRSHDFPLPATAVWHKYRRGKYTISSAPKAT